MSGFPKQFRIADRPVGRDAPCLVIGEVGQAHDGSLGTAHAYIDALAQAGVDAVKFQTHIASEESTPHEPWRVRFSPQDESRYAYWKRMEFTPEQWAGLKRHCDEAGVIFLSTPFSQRAVDWLQKLDIAAWKMASGEISNHALLEICGATGRPVLLSSGMSSFAELDAAVAVLAKAKSPLAVLQCTTRYPCPPEAVGLNVMAELEQRYDCPTGLSDHSGQIYAGLAAVALGAKLLEVHATFSKQAFGPDVPASLTPDQLSALVQGVRAIEAMRAAPVDKDAAAAELEPLRRLFNKSVVLARDLPGGTVLAREHLALKKPGSGIPAREIERVIGRKLVHALPADHLLSDGDLTDT
ncbi:MAG TPA: N-acetylneuraminate synthase family protein [Myxococcota bacterium]